ncbi:MAG TPA: AI-2E family transporter [Longimicrobiaceae bacterium]|jgi:predicted PurR-regulated permease PerM|nr:AI-2E family transporter [Longimicrobiaceae bacterium]
MSIDRNRGTGDDDGFVDKLRGPDSVLTPDVDPRADAEPNAPGGPEPDTGKLGEAMRRSPRVRNIGLTILVVLAVFYTLYFARGFFLPVVFAMLFNFLLSPAIRALNRLRIPSPLGAALVMLALLGGLGLGIWQLADPVQSWISRGPQSFTSTVTKLRKLGRPVAQVSRTADQVEKATNAVAGPTRTPEVVVKGPSFGERLFGTTQTLVTSALEVIILLYFLLAAGDLFLQKLVGVLPNLNDKKTAVRIARQMEASVSTYLLTLAMLNTVLGCAVAAVMWALGMPNPVLWGVLAGLLEFVPYVGAATMLAVLSIAGLATFDKVGHALLVPACYLLVNFVQANFLAPTVMGRRLTLNPVAILIGLALWWEMWGVAGVFIAVPLLATFKICCDHIETLAPVGEFLSK